MHKSIGLKLLRLFAGVMVLAAVLCGCGVQQSPQKKEQTTVEPVAEQTFTGIITHVDKKLKQISVRDIDTDVDTIVNYDATALITDKYKKEIDGDELETGQLMKTTYRTEDSGLVSMEIPEDAWEYNKVDKFSFDTEESSMEVADQLYQYSSQTYFGTTDNKKIDMLELSDSDELTVRGIGYKVYSVIRTEGHGYIKLQNYNDFIGGMINIDDNMILPVTKDMLITVSCGTYRVTISKDVAKASKTITVKEDKESILDFGDYKKSVKNIGNVRFKVDPQGADLFINGTRIDYSKSIALNYGTYSVTASLNGYNTYTGQLTVAEADKTINITLEPKEDTASAATAEPQATTTPEPAATKAATKSKTKKIDSKHTISVTAPEGAEVYLDDVYKGIVPCKFTKVIGSQTVTLSQTGYVTKSYSIDILNDDKNVKLSFSDLVEDADK